MILPTLSDGPTPPTTRAPATRDQPTTGSPEVDETALRQLAREIARSSPNLASVLVSSGMRRLLANR